MKISAWVSIIGYGLNLVGWAELFIYTSVGFYPMTSIFFDSHMGL
jgi:hypothetical protein